MQVQRKPPKIAYLIPNFFTSGSIFSGVFSIAYAIEGHYVLASWMIFVALLFDGLDGRMARLTRTTSSFGVEFDSLADIVSFGVAPGAILFTLLAENNNKITTILLYLFVFNIWHSKCISYMRLI